MSLRRRPPKGNVRMVKASGNNLRWFCVNKSGETFQCESLEEYKHALRLLFDITVIDFVSQPMEIEFQDENGKWRKYTPDFLVSRIGGQKELHEVTRSDRRLSRLDSIRREHAARVRCKELGLEFVSFSEHQLPQATEFANLDALKGCAPLSYKDKEVFDLVLEKLPEQGTEICAADLCREIAEALDKPEGVVQRTMCYMIWHQYIASDLVNILLLDKARFTRKAKLWYEE